MIKSKKQMYIIISVFALILFLGGTTYAWFSYSRTTSDNELIAGDIYLHLNEGQGEIELTNVFPETVEEARSINDNFITFTVDGLNTSNKTIYYEFILDHGEDKASPKTRYNDADLRFDLIALDSNGDEIDYLISGGSFDTLINKRIWVDTVDANTTTEIVRRYKLRMWLDENVIISDTDPKATYDTTEYKNKYATIKLTVAGDFNEKHIDYLYNIMRKSAVMDNVSSEFVSASTGIDFGAIFSDTNGKGIYTRAGTENDTYPIMYYRGDVDNNNIIFANKCWKAVRTTDTGGVKLIYNGVPSALRGALSQSDYTIQSNNGGFVYDTTESAWIATITSGSSQELSFTVPAGNDYTFSFEGYTGGAEGSVYLYKGANYVQGITGNGGGPNSTVLYSHDEATLTSSDVMKFSMGFSGATPENPATLKIKVTHLDATLGMGCDNSGSASQITLNVSGTDKNLFKFSTDSGAYKSPAYNGYMYGTVYEYSTENWTSGARFGSSFTWDGTNYKLVDASVTTPNATHHYSCNSTDAEATCTDLRYVYYVNSSTKFYITLTGGDGVEEALAKMQTNTTNSNAKDKIDTWYLANMTSYTNKLEDTVWCNDRSIGRANGWSATGGWGTSDYKQYSLLFGASERSNYASDTSTVKNQPSLECTNKNDRFTVNNANGNQALTYPTALLTEDEIVLAGGLAGSASTFYLNNGTYYWSLSPHHFGTLGNAYEFVVGNGGALYSGVSGTNGLRPVVSLKPGTPVVSGTGTVADPYVVE